jgi:hypothetical protein
LKFSTTKFLASGDKPAVAMVAISNLTLHLPVGVWSCDDDWTFQKILEDTLEHRH